MRDTSLNAYYSLLSKLGERQTMVLRYIFTHPNETDMEITRGMGFDDGNAVKPRRKELLDQGLIKETWKRKCTVTNNLAMTWETVKEKDFKPLIKTCLSDREMNNLREKILFANSFQREELKSLLLRCLE